MQNSHNHRSLMGATLCALLIPLTVHSQDLPGSQNQVTEDQLTVQHAEGEDKTNKTDQKCLSKSSGDEFVDRMRSRTHKGVCRSVAWLDSLFGDEYEFDDSDFSSKLSLGFRQDEYDGFDPRLRVRIRAKLPNASERLNAFIGRVEEDSYISNTEVNEDSISAQGLRSTNDDDDEWLLGLGYRNPNQHNNGFDYSLGAKISSGFNPYAKIRHRYLFEPTNKNFWRTTQTLFWRNDEKFGFSTRLDYTKIINDRDIFEWDTSAKYTEETEQWEWISGTSWHHSFSATRGLSSRVYIRGEEENEVSIPEYGLNFTYIREFLRPWLFIETGIDFRWEKQLDNTSYESAVRFAMQLEMVMGDYYGSKK